MLRSLATYLSAYFRSDNSATSRFFGTRHLDILYDKWQKSEKKAEGCVILEPGTKEHEEYRDKNPEFWDSKYKNAKIILHPEYGLHF